MNWKILNDCNRAACVVLVGIGGCSFARDGQIEAAIFTVLFLLMIFIGIKSEKKIKKLENTILEQESVILRTQYIRNRMLEDGLLQ